MDPRTDSYLSAQANEGGPSLFDPARDILPTELLWLVDELLRLEVTTSTTPLTVNFPADAG